MNVNCLLWELRFVFLVIIIKFFRRGCIKSVVSLFGW